MPRALHPLEFCGRHEFVAVRFGAEKGLCPFDYNNSRWRVVMAQKFEDFQPLGIALGVAEMGRAFPLSGPAINNSTAPTWIDGEDHEMAFNGFDFMRLKIFIPSVVIS